MHKYLIVIDMQNDFVDGALGTAEACAVVPVVVQRMNSAQDEGRTLLFTQDTHTANYMETSEGRNLPIPHCVEGTDGWQLAPAIAPYAHETIKKPTFGSVELVRLLTLAAKANGQNLDIALCGVCTDICVVSNALLLRAHFPEARISVYPEACAGTTPERHRAALDVMASCQIAMA